MTQQRKLGDYLPPGEIREKVREMRAEIATVKKDYGFLWRIHDGASSWIRALEKQIAICNDRLESLGLEPE